jgi:hypothetical protein
MRLVDGRLTRGLTAGERRRYLPNESSLGWLSSYLRF